MSGAVVLLIAVFVAAEAVPVLADIGLRAFLFDASWHPAPDAADGTFGLLPMVAGTLLVGALALALAVPLGMASALFCQFYAPPRMGSAYRRLVEVLAGIPSVVYGFWGLVVVVPWIARLSPPGPSLLAGGLVLAVMVLPTLALEADAALAAVPRELLQGAAALGLSRAATVLGVALPAARSGLAAGLLLAAGRALGETMAVLMVCGNVVRVPDSVFDPVRTLTANIALEMAYALDDHRGALFVTGLVLLALVTVLVWLADRLGGGLRHA